MEGLVYEKTAGSWVLPTSEDAQSLESLRHRILDDLFVDPAERGQRLGEALIEELVKIAKSKGWPKIRWITADDNYRARTLYDRVAQKTMWNTYEIVVE